MSKTLKYHMIFYATENIQIVIKKPTRFNVLLITKRSRGQHDLLVVSAVLCPQACSGQPR